jgi:hypothetical protein
MVYQAQAVSFEECTWSDNGIKALTTATEGVRGGGAIVFGTPQVQFSKCDFLSNYIDAPVNGTEAGLGGLAVGMATTLSIDDCR